MNTFDVTKLPMNMRTKILVNVEGPTTNGAQCWDWFGATNSKGYGCVGNGRGGSQLTHRSAYELLVGPIEAGLTIDHLCQNKVCVNTDHMEVVTRAENTRRMLALQTHCKQGHPLTGDNLRLKTRKTGLTYRTCLECSRKWQRASYEKQILAA